MFSYLYMFLNLLFSNDKKYQQQQTPPPYKYVIRGFWLKGDEGKFTIST